MIFAPKLLIDAQNAEARADVRLDAGLRVPVQGRRRAPQTKGGRREREQLCMAPPGHRRVGARWQWRDRERGAAEPRG